MGTDNIDFAGRQLILNKLITITAPLAAPIGIAVTSLNSQPFLFDVLGIPVFTSSAGPWKQIASAVTVPPSVWGLDYDGKVQCSNVNAQNMPSAEDTFYQISLSPNARCGVLVDGIVKCWWTLLDNLPIGGKPFGSAETYVQVATYGDTVCAVRNSGPVDCYNIISRKTCSVDGVFIQIDVSSSMSCGVNAEGSIVCWTVDCQPLSPMLNSTTGGFVQVSVTERVVCGVDMPGAVWC
ncbi:MAG: hypothetical protein P1U78_13925 [Alcanivoracaceae bacterium]|nr:hypothetical protein [Alcanivoracaceae bacterium]